MKRNRQWAVVMGVVGLLLAYSGCEKAIENGLRSGLESGASSIVTALVDAIIISQIDE